MKKSLTLLLGSCNACTQQGKLTRAIVNTECEDNQSCVHVFDKNVKGTNIVGAKCVRIWIEMHDILINIY